MSLRAAFRKFSNKLNACIMDVNLIGILQVYFLICFSFLSAQEGVTYGENAKQIAGEKKKLQEVKNSSRENTVCKMKTHITTTL